MSKLYTSLKTLLIASTLSLVLLGSHAYANENSAQDRAHGKKHHRIERLIEKLELTDNQAVQFKEIMAEKAQLKSKKREQKKANRELIKDGFVDQAAENAANNARQHIYASAEIRQRLSTILTQEQLVMMESMKSKKRHHKKRHKSSRQEQSTTE